MQPAPARLFQRFALPLARIPLEHGYPPVPASLFNLWRFSPLLNHYGGKVINKVAAENPNVSVKVVEAGFDPGNRVVKQVVDLTGEVTATLGAIIERDQIWFIKRP